MASDLQNALEGHLRGLEYLLYRRATELTLGLTLLVVVLMRTAIPYDRVFREDAVVLVANDPYAYRYFQESLLASGLRPYRLGDLAGLPADVAAHDVLFIVTTWVFSTALGGDATAAATVLAWYPVVMAVVIALLVYWLAVLLTDDKRVAILAALVLAVTPIFIYRTMLGFGDHHPFKYLWVILGAVALVRLATLERGEDDGVVLDRPVFWMATVMLAVAVAAVTLAWRAGPLMLVPIGAYAALTAVSCVRAGRSPVHEHVGLILGLGLASVLVVAAFFGLGWGSAYRAVAPLLLLALVLGVLVGAELVHPLGLPWQAAAVGVTGVVGAWAALLWAGPAWMAEPIGRMFSFIGGRLGDPPVGPGEGVSLLGGVAVPFQMFGLLLLIALPVFAWLTRHVAREHRPEWLVLWVYTGWFFVLSLALIRWAAQLSMFVAVLAAMGLLYLVAELGYARPVAAFETVVVGDAEPEDPGGGSPAPSLLQSGGVVVALVLLATVVGLVFVPGTMGVVTFDDTEVDTAQWMADRSAAEALSYPDNYVLADHRTYRFYNYFVSGESRSESRFYDRSFIVSTDPTAYDHDRLADMGKAGFVVTQDWDVAYPDDSMQARLHDRYGSAGDGVAGLGSFRLVHVSDDATRNVFAVVEGATMTGTAQPGAEVTVETDVEVDGTAFTYRQTAEADDEGAFQLTVAYPGTYEVGLVEVTVTEEAVESGETIELGWWVFWTP